MKMTARDRKVLIIGGVVVAAALIYFLADSVIPSRAALTAEVGTKKKTILAERELLGQEENYKARVEQYRKRLEQDRTRLLPGDNPNLASAELQKVLADLASRNGVDIIRKDVRPEQKIQDKLVKVSVHIEINCLPDQLVQFLAAIENYDKFLKIDMLFIQWVRLQRKDEIRPSMNVAGFIVTPEAKPAEKAPGE